MGRAAPHQEGKVGYGRVSAAYGQLWAVILLDGR